MKTEIAKAEVAESLQLLLESFPATGKTEATGEGAMTRDYAAFTLYTN